MRKILGAAVLVVGGLLGGLNEAISSRERSLASYVAILFLAIFIMGIGVALWKSSKGESDSRAD